jgi:Leucine rich repeat
MGGLEHRKKTKLQAVTMIDAATKPSGEDARIDGGDGVDSVADDSCSHSTSDNDDDNGAVSSAPVILTLDKATGLCPKNFRLIAKSGRFTMIEDLSSLTALDYVDVTDNALTSLEGLAGLPGLKTIIARSNKLKTIDVLLDDVPAVRVLNLADNEFTSIDWLLHAQFAKSLNALILNGNNLSNLRGVSACAALETLVVSGNVNVSDINLVVLNCPQLRKLSAAHTSIRIIPDDIASCSMLVELRVSHNRIEALPGADVLSRLSALKILDVGHNLITSIDSLSAVSGSLQQLNLAGNPVYRLMDTEGSAGKGADVVKQTVMRLCSGLQIFDGVRIAGGRRKIRISRERKAQHEERRARELDRRAPKVGIVDGALEMFPSVRASMPSHRKRSRANESVAPDESTMIQSAFTNETDAVAAIIEDDDDALDADAFVAHAMAKNVAGIVPVSSRMSKETSIRGKKTKRQAPTDTSDFGTGGPSVWE